MKKILLFLLMTICLLSLSSCDKDGKDVEDATTEALPGSTKNEPFFAGNTVTIKGTGFTEKSEIWIRKAAVKAAEEVKATITEVTETFITFEVPDVLGEQDIVLKQGDEEKVLGKMFFAREEVYGFATKYDGDDPTSSHLVKYDAKTNTTAKHADIDGLYMCTSNVISLNNALYFGGVKVISLAEEVDDFGVFKYDLKTNTISALISSRDGEFTYNAYIFVIEDQVHAIVAYMVYITVDNPEDLGQTKFSHSTVEVFNLSSGTAVSVRKFETIKVNGVNAKVSNNNIVYDEKTKSILANASIMKDTTDAQFLLSLSVEDGEIKSSSSDGNASLFTLGDKVYQEKSFYTEGAFTHSDYYEFNPETLKVGTTKLGTATREDDYRIEEMFFLNSLNKVFAKRENYDGPDNSSPMSLSLYDIDAVGEKVTRTAIVGYDNADIFFCVVNRTE